jgi:hypothetical protein
MTVDLIIEPWGLVRCIYAEEIDLHQIGELSIQRGSDVEPDEHGQWHVDLSPISGPVLGPFPQRSAAIAAEIAWLREHWLLNPLSTNNRSTT